MTVLEKSARNQLDKAVQAARRAATTGADRALQALSVEQEKKPAHLSPEQSELRRQLRVVFRRLGSWDALVRAVAYEQWHRMLFARFLAENKLLIHPKYHAPVTLDECAELARDRGIDQWEVAAEFAAGMLPGIFQKEDPLLLLKFAPEDRAALQEILSGIPAGTFQTQDALGWTYQFWQTEEKAKVNDSERKIEGADICAVTQLFTEPYMVQFLLQNTLGAWWLSLHPESPLRKDWVYYKDQVQHDFSAFPQTAKDLKILDPSCGSGHFLVEAFHMLLAMRQAEGESRDNAIKGIVQDNLHGLELDPRCIQIAGFAVAMEAWKSGFPTDQYLPLPNLACVGLPIRAEKSEWLKLAAGDGMLENALGQYYDLFRNADNLGSLILIDESRTLIPSEILMKKLESALAKEKEIGDPVAEAFGETARGVLKTSKFLLNKYNFVMTNVPYLSRGKHNQVLREFCEFRYPNSKNDIATVFLERCLSFCQNGGQLSIVLPQNWLFLITYKKLRESLLKKEKWDLLIRLGPGAFETISGEVVKAILLNISHSKATPEHQLFGIDVSKERSVAEKNASIINSEMQRIPQKKLLGNPDFVITFEEIDTSKSLSLFVDCLHGLAPGDTAAYTAFFWEIENFNRWKFMSSTPNHGSIFSGKEKVLVDPKIIMDNNCPGFRFDGRSVHGKKGLLIGKMTDLPLAYYGGELFDNNVHVIAPKDPKDLPALWAFFRFGEITNEVRKVDQKLDVTASAVLKISFDLAHWQKVAEEQGPLPEPHSDDPTQWLFKGNIIGCEQPLHVAIARMLGYRWPEQPAGDDPIDALADKDGIVCIPPVWGERPAADALRSILATAYGADWSPRKEEELLRQVGYTKSGGLEGFLRDEFFKSHCALFHQRPFIWQVWDSTKDGFSAFINYHKLDHNNLQKLIYTYLGNWITQQKDEVRQEKPGAERRLAAAEELKKNLEKILEGEKPFDIYVRWKPLDQQAIGWDPDLNDGVRMNIRPFVEAGVLRGNPNIKWGKDRGTDPVPNCSGTTERLNDLHFSLEEKRDAQEKSLTK